MVPGPSSSGPPCCVNGETEAHRAVRERQRLGLLRSSVSAFFLGELRTPGWGAGSKRLKAQGDPGPALQGFESQLGLCRPLPVGLVCVLRPSPGPAPLSPAASQSPLSDHECTGAGLGGAAGPASAQSRGPPCTAAGLGPHSPPQQERSGGFASTGIEALPKIRSTRNCVSVPVLGRGVVPAPAPSLAQGPSEHYGSPSGSKPHPSPRWAWVLGDPAAVRKRGLIPVGAGCEARFPTLRA